METTKLQTLTHQYIHTHTKLKRKKYDLYTPPFLIVNKRLPNKYFILFFAHNLKYKRVIVGSAPSTVYTLHSNASYTLHIIVWSKLECSPPRPQGVVTMTRSLVDVRLFSSRMGASRWDSDPKGGAETVREKKCNRCIAYSWPDRCCVVIHGYIFFQNYTYCFFCLFFFSSTSYCLFRIYCIVNSYISLWAAIIHVFAPRCSRFG